MQVAEIELLGRSAPVDVTQPGDPTIASSDDSPGSEGVANAIDNQPTKYLNFDRGTNNDDIDSGLVVSPSIGSTVLVGIGMQSANDAPDRDPLSIRLEGSNDEAPGWDSGNWSVIYETPADAKIQSWEERFPDDHRFQQQNFFFDNTTAYKHYRWTVLETQGPSGCCFQIAEIELFAFPPGVNCESQDARIITPPVSAPVLEGEGAEFFTEVNGPWQVQWSKNGEPIPGAVQLRFTTDPVTPDNAGDVYSVQIVGDGCEPSDEVQTIIHNPDDFPESIGINFVGGGANGAPTQTDTINIGGDQLQAYWNNLPPEGDGTEAGEQEALRNSRSETTDIAVEWTATRRWGAGTGTDDTNAKLFNGLIEGGADEESASEITFSNVPDPEEGETHSLIAYSIARPLEFPTIDLELTQTGERLFMRQQNADEYNADPVLLRVTSADAGARSLGNFVRFDGITPVDGEVTLRFWDGPGNPVTDTEDSTVNAVQLILNAPRVGPIPTILSQPVSANGGTGGEVVLRVSAQNASSYQWNFNGVAIAGATGPTLTLTDIDSDAEGQYTVDVVNEFGVTKSSVAVVTEVDPDLSGRINDRLLGHYKFDETNGATAANSAGGAANANVMNAGADQWIEGLIGNALNFNGADNWAFIPNYDKPVSGMSLSLWVVSNSAVEFDYDTAPDLVRSWGAGIGQFRLGFDDTGDGEDDLFELAAQLSVGPNEPSVRDSDEGEFPAGRWTHVAFTADGANLTLYLNGIAIARSAYLGDLSPGQFEWIVLGALVDDTGNPGGDVEEIYWDGAMDDLGIWSRPLSANEVANIYLNGLQGLDLTNARDVAPEFPTFDLTQFTRDAATGDVTIGWEASPGLFYAVQTSTNLLDWEELVSGLEEGLFTHTNVPQDSAVRFYRALESEPPPFYSIDFEDGDGGWTATNAAGDTQWELGTPAYLEELTTAASGTQAWGTDLDDAYGPSTVALLRSPVLDPSEIRSPQLSFNYYIDSTFEEEGGQIRFLDENGELITAVDEIFSGKSDTWTPYSIRFPREARGRQVIIEFALLTAGASEPHAGWFIDDVVVD